MMHIKTTSPDFRKIFDALAHGNLDANAQALRTETARRIIAHAGRKLGHIVSMQGNAAECCRCGASCALDPDAMTVTGPLAREACSP